MVKKTEKDSNTVADGRAQADGTTRVVITAPNTPSHTFRIDGDTPFVQLKFSEKAKAKIRGGMLEGSTARSKKNRTPRDFEDDFKQAMHRSTEGWCGIPAGAFRAAMISACRLVGFKMTLAKLSVFVKADGFDEEDGTPLVRIYGEPRAVEHIVRNANGMPDIRVRAMWDKWYANVTVKYDRDQFTLQDVANLMMRVGVQVGIGEGRPDSKSSCGMGWGTFTVGNAMEKVA